MACEKRRKRYDLYVYYFFKRCVACLLKIRFPFSANEPDELCASMYSFHSSPEEKNKLLFALTQHGIETTVDRVAKKKRIRDWIQESVIQEEENEEEEDDDDDEEETRHTSPIRAPVAGHVSSVRAQEKEARTQIVSTVKDAANKHINPRTGKIQLGPSEMGHNTPSNNVEQSSHDHTVAHSKPVDHSNVQPEVRRENDGYDYRRTTKLVDVGSQTSSESQKQLEAANNATRTNTPERSSSIGATINSNSMQTVSHTPPILPYSNSKSQNTQTNLSRIDQTTSRGFMSAFNSLASVTVPVVIPEVQQVQPKPIQQHMQPVSSSHNTNIIRDRSKPRPSYQRHNTTILTKQPISRSVHNFNSFSPINDSGYGSLDKLRSNDGTKASLASPTFSKHSIVQSKLITLRNGSGNAVSNEIIHINGLSHSQNESNSPFHSDSGGDGSPHGSNGFVNYTGVNTSSTFIPTESRNSNIRISMKDTAYDRVRGSRRKR